MTTNGSPGSTHVPALRVRGVSKTFAGVSALDNVSFDVEHGEIHALLGGNGSGKSTLIKILAGVYQADSGGTLEFNGCAVPAHSMTPAFARHSNLRFVHQDPGLFPELTVADNIAMRSGFPTRLGRIRKSLMDTSTRRILESFDIDARPGQRLGELRPADQTMVAIGRALEREDDELPSLLVLDEPTASLPEDEVGILLSAVRRRAEAGQGIIYVSHRIDEVLAIADTVTILRDGRHIITQPAKNLSESELISHIAGRPIDLLFGEPAKAPPESATVLTVQGLRGGPLRDVAFDVRGGEVLGIAGLLGSGRTELLQMLFGAVKREAGSIQLMGREFGAGHSVRTAMQNGVAFVPENRSFDAAFPDTSVTINLSMARVRSYSRFGRISQRREHEEANTAIEEFAIRPADPRAIFSALSGGNQQKVVLSRWRRRDPALLLLDEPTQGVDVGARADIYAAVRRATGGGASVVLVSSDMEELVHACDRVVVLHDGRITTEVTKEMLTRERLTHLTYTGKGDLS